MTVPQSRPPYHCEYGDDACEFFKKHVEKVYHQPIERSQKAKVLTYVTETGIWSAVQAATNYLSGGDPLAGALFIPLAKEINRGLNFILPMEKISCPTQVTKTYTAKALTIRGVSMLVAASALNALGYPVTKTTLVVDLIPRITGLALIVGLTPIIRAKQEKKIIVDHFCYHVEQSKKPLTAQPA